LKYPEPDPTVWASWIRNYLYGFGFFHQQAIKNEENRDFYCFLTFNDLLFLKTYVNVVTESTFLASIKQPKKDSRIRIGNQIQIRSVIQCMDPKVRFRIKTLRFRNTGFYINKTVDTPENIQRRPFLYFSLSSASTLGCLVSA